MIEQFLDEEVLIVWKWHCCQKIDLIIFGFLLHDEQVNTIRMFFFEQNDLILLTKTGFGKNLIFQLLLFLSLVTELVIILMPLKLLQAKQSTIINRILNTKSIVVLNKKNNLILVHKEIVKGRYTHFFISPKITLSKKFKINILDHLDFFNRLCLLAIDEIHLVYQWG